jgi:hypothetical protein
MKIPFQEIARTMQIDNTVYKTSFVSGENLNTHEQTRMGVRFTSRLKIKYMTVTVLVIITLQYSGVFMHIFELDFYTKFSYPQEGDIQKYVLQLGTWKYLM